MRMQTLSQIKEYIQAQRDIREKARDKEWDGHGHTDKFDRLDAEAMALISVLGTFPEKIVLPCDVK